MTELVLKLPSDYQIPAVYQTTSEEINKIILDMGAELVKNITTTGTDKLIFDRDRRIEELERTNTSLNELRTEISKSFKDGIACITQSSRDNLSNVVAGLQLDIGKVLSSQREDDKKGKEKFDRQMIELGELANKIMNHQARLDNAVSAVKGRVNEENSRQLIIDTFGSIGTGFAIAEKTIHAGDHIFDWCGLKIMWEDKLYKEMVGDRDINKALEDFSGHQECDALIFVSAISSIKGHESNSDIDLDVVEGRLVMYISNLRKKPDVPGYVKSIIQPILISLCTVLKQAKESNNINFTIGKIEQIKPVIKSLLEQIKTSERLQNELAKSNRTKLTAMKENTNEMKGSLISILSIISDSEIIRMSPLVKNDDDNEENEDLFADGMEEEEEVVPVKSTRKCGLCGQPGHTRTRCSLNISPPAKRK